MGEMQNWPFQLWFKAFLKVDFQGSRVTSDGGLILVFELDERLGIGDLIAQHLTGFRRGKNTQLPLADLLHQSVYSRIAGHKDVNDARRLAQDPTFPIIKLKWPPLTPGGTRHETRQKHAAPAEMVASRINPPGRQNRYFRVVIPRTAN